MKILNIRTIAGPNVYHHRPILIMSIDLETLADIASNDLASFNESLLELLPGLRTHHCSPRYSGGFVERLNRGTYFAHIIEHIALELSELSGIGVSYGKSIFGGAPGIYKVIIRYKNETAMKYILESSVKLAAALAQGEIFDLEACLTKARQIIKEEEFGPSTAAILNAAKKRNIPWRRLNDKNLIQLGYGKYRQFIQATTSSMTNDISVDIAQDKNLTKKMLQEASVRVPRGRPAYSLLEAFEVLEEIQMPVAVKPLDGNHGRGVTLNVITQEEMQLAFENARKHSNIVMIEEFIKGKDYRILMIGGKMVAASERIPAFVIGDGVHNLNDLITIENQNPLRGFGHELPLTKISINEETINILKKKLLTLQSIPSKDQIISLKDTANLSTGGMAIDTTNLVHPEIISTCERAARIVGLDICGIDLMAEDISLPLRVQQGGIIEVNAGPGIRMHHYPSVGEVHDVGAAIIENLYPNNSNGRIPIISITGTNGKTTVSRLLSHIVELQGLCVGTTTTDGIYINNILIDSGDTTGPISARTVLTDPSVEVAVLETARGGIIKRGLGYDWSDVGIFTNLEEDHIGQDGIEELADILKIKSLVIERVRSGGSVILNADSKEIVGLTLDPKTQLHTKKLTYFSLVDDNPAVLNHLAQGGHAYFIKDNYIIEAQGKNESAIVEIQDIPLTLGGTAKFHVANVMAVIAGAHAIGIPDDIILKGLMSFDHNKNSGRTNLYKIDRGFLLLDYGHNPDAISSICEMGRKWNITKLTGVIGAPGDRSDQSIKNLGKSAALLFDKIIIREDLDLRERNPGEIPELLRNAITEINPTIETKLILSSEDALRNAIKELTDKELIVFFYEELEGIEDKLLELGATKLNDPSLFNSLFNKAEFRNVQTFQKGDEWLQYSY